MPVKTLAQFDAEIQAARGQQSPAAPDEGGTSEEFAPRAGESLPASMLRYGGEELKGLRRSPMDAVKGLLGMPMAAIRGLAHPTEGLPALVQDPSLLKEAPAAAWEGVKHLATHPDALGSLLGQAVLGKAAPMAANTALAKGPTMVGRAMGAVGRGAEAVGTSKALNRATPISAIGTAISGHPGMAALELALPPALEYGGRALQRGGAALDGLDLSFKSATKVPVSSRYPDAPEGFTPKSTEVKGYSGRPQRPTITPDDVTLYRETVAKGMAPDAALRVVAGPSKGAQGSLRGLVDAGMDARGIRADSRWASDASAQPDIPVVKQPLSPIEQFYRANPQARVGGEGMMTGQFEEGSGGLADVAAGRMTPHTRADGSLFPLDELSQMSGRGLSPKQIQDLLKKYKGWEVQ